MHTIGDLAHRTGLTVKAIRFYADTGLVPPTARNQAGHRVYDATAAARLALVKTLRDLGLDLPAIRRVVDREATLAAVAAAHVEALEARIRTLRLHQAVLGLVARRGTNPEEVEVLKELATLTEAERKRLIVEFIDSAFDGVNCEFDGIARSLTPELPNDPEPEQVEAWVELAEMISDPDFRMLMRRLAEHHVSGAVPGAVPRPGVVAVLHERVRPLVAAGVAPSAPEGAAVVAEVSARWPGDLAALVETVNDPRRERYLRLLAAVNGWAAPESARPVLDWVAEALRAG
ncbi:MerR family transcriptional regulator [Umezawaea endophytica]|uniref:MerR family transcriptional regulator n=1 Tax=Umezawaea endophytica TaxID=1654476 RepID=A0A9X2VNE4_9PSEU|nr:MerR family transcriptional regulator [Umezawaea endophytica]MCS7479705.1 MerR family transcriptional regulator [Umezawaea endophytica]